ncbi:MAG: choice-of-anchor B family protein, partial [Flavobacteriales bacterium]|nr:choice-of-anchor B family protein [Flavobacteriales bacterium]
MKKELLVVAIVLIAATSFAQSLCENGLAAGLYPCKNVDLLSTLGTGDLGGGNIEMNDIWGWVDPNSGREFVIIGKTNGTSFVEVTDPVNPVYLGDLPTHTVNSIWRDIKVYNNHAFIVSEASGHGMQVFDLTQLLSVASPQTFTNTAHYGSFGNAHNIVINESVGRAYAVGTNTFSGGLHIVDISDPANPTILGDYADDGYTHDAQVVTYSGPDADYGGVEVAINCNEDAVTIVNVDDPSDTQTISTISYPGFEYTHQGWLTDDQRYLLVDDELDENGNGHNTRTYIFNVEDLDAPVYLGFYESTEAAIDHNLYNDANLCYQSNYRSGLRILDITDVANANLTEVAYFDLYPQSNSAQFNGAWSSYPYFPSGVVAVSH